MLLFQRVILQWALLLLVVIQPLAEHQWTQPWLAEHQWTQPWPAGLLLLLTAAAILWPLLCL
jgi:hypothetical protein